jgi:hypothetical protein
MAKIVLVRPYFKKIKDKFGNPKIVGVKAHFAKIKIKPTKPRKRRV